MGVCDCCKKSGEIRLVALVGLNEAYQPDHHNLPPLDALAPTKLCENCLKALNVAIASFVDARLESVSRRSQ